MPSWEDVPLADRPVIGLSGTQWLLCQQRCAARIDHLRVIGVSGTSVWTSQL
jgi:hypothetical protein